MNPMDPVEQFKEEYQFRLDPSTIQHYQRSVRQLLHHVQQPIETVTKQDIRNWFMSLEAKGYKSSSIATKLIGLTAFFAYCEEDRLVSINPTKGIPFPKMEEKLPTYLKLAEIAVLRATVKSDRLEAAIIEVFLSTGVRFNELRYMKKTDINWAQRSILIRGKRNKERLVLFTKECNELLKAYLDSRTDAVPYVFIDRKATREIGSKRLYHLFDIYSKAVGRHLTPHMLRYTFAVTLMRKGMAIALIQELMGHDSKQTTRRYTKLYNQELKNKYDEWT